MASSKYLIGGAMTYLMSKSKQQATEMSGPENRQAICVMNSEPNQTAKGVVNFE